MQRTLFPPHLAPAALPVPAPLPPSGVSGEPSTPPPLPPELATRVGPARRVDGSTQLAGGQSPTLVASRRLHCRLPILPFCAEAMVRTTEQDGALWHLFDARDVPRFYAQEKYTCFLWHGANGPEEHLLVDSLDTLQHRLAAFAFVRTHRAELVNLRFLRRVSLPGRGGQIVMELSDGQCAPVSRRRMGEVRAVLCRMRGQVRLPEQLGVRALPV